MGGVRARAVAGRSGRARGRVRDRSLRGAAGGGEPLSANLPPDDGERSELDDALFNTGAPDETQALGAPRHDSDQELWALEDELFGESTAPAADAAPPPAEPLPDLEFGAEPTVERAPRPAPESSPEADSTAMFAAVVPEAETDAGPTRRQRRSASDRGSGRIKRLGFAALVVLMVAGVGGLAYAALGRNEDATGTKHPQVEVRGTEVTRTTLRPTTTSSSPSTTSTAPTTSTTPPTSTTRAGTRAPVEAPATEPPVDQPPVVTDPPPPPVTDPPPPPTTQPPPPTTTQPPPPTTTTEPVVTI